MEYKFNSTKDVNTVFENLKFGVIMSVGEVRLGVEDLAGQVGSGHKKTRKHF